MNPNRNRPPFRGNDRRVGMRTESRPVVPRKMPFGKPWLCETCNEPIGVFSTDPEWLDNGKHADTVQMKRKDMFVMVTLVEGKVRATCYRCGRINSVTATKGQNVTLVRSSPQP